MVGLHPPKHPTLTLRAGPGDFLCNRTGEVLRVTAGSAFPPKRAKFRGITKKFQCLLRVVADSFQNLPESV